MSQPIQRFTDCYRQLNPYKLESLREVYHDDINFVDPVKNLQGWQQLYDYFCSLYRHVYDCRFDIVDSLGDEQQGYVSWSMFIKHPRLDYGQSFTVAGCSQLRFSEGRVIYQRDFFDMGNLLYEHLPVLSGAVGYVKKHFAQEGAREH